MSEIINLKNINFSYDKKSVLKNITFSANRKEVVGIIGPNGAGKTTLLKIILNLLEVDKGTVTISGTNIKNYDNRELAKEISYVKQKIEDIHKTVFEYILAGRTPYFDKYQIFEKQVDSQIAKKYIDMLYIEKLVEKKISNLSGGETQLVQIAKCLTQESPIMLLDEPTSHLDISYQIKILNILKEINKEMDITIIMVLHDLNLASEYCDRILMLNDGNVFCEGKPHKVLTYQNIEEVYDTMVIVKENPLSKNPHVIPVTKSME